MGKFAISWEVEVRGNEGSDVCKGILLLAPNGGEEENKEAIEVYATTKCT